ncbi:MAG TPA: 50S ribosomal protein L21 [Candidatus Peribacterales bacterium]|nr:50S ribosomal protein L21 [Candidatus Peribacterales bacterium]
MAYAIVDIAGFQEKVHEGAELQVSYLGEKKAGDKVVFPGVLLFANDKSDVRIGTPFVAGSSVEATIVAHGQGEKIRVFKMKHRKRYRRTQGHRPMFTSIKVTKLVG